MGRGVQEENSSSPSDNPKLVQAERTGTAGERIKLQLSDGSCFFVSEQDLRDENISPVELIPDFTFTKAVIQRLQDGWLRRQVQEKALSLLARAPHSAFSLRMKLLKRGYDSPKIEQTLSWLTKKGYLDDSRFAESWLRSRIERRAEGRAVLVAGLLRKGLTREVAERVVNSFVTERVEYENAAKALDKMRRQGVTDQDKLMRKLRTRGFSFPLIRKVLQDNPEGST
jgi:regulatory protein